MITEEMVEAAAVAMCNDGSAYMWNRMPEKSKDLWRNDARIALEAAEQARPKPKHVAVVSQIPRNGPRSISWRDRDLAGIPDGTLLYTAPPAPAEQLPALVLQLRAQRDRALQAEENANANVADLLDALDTIASYYQPTAVDAASMVKIAKDAADKVKGGAV